MKAFNVIVALLLLGALGCSGDNITGALDEADGLAAGKTGVMTDGMVRYVENLTYTPDMTRGLKICMGGVPIPEYYNIQGRVYYLGQTTGSMAVTACHLTDNGSLDMEGTWRLTGEEGHMIQGTWMALAKDGKMTGHTVIDGGIGKFAEATGWTRFTGTTGSETGVGSWIGNGLISAPKAVTSKGFMTEFSLTYGPGGTACRDDNGDTVFTGRYQGDLEGLVTYLGRSTGHIVNEECVAYDQDHVTFFGTWMYAGADGDTIYGIHELALGDTPNTLTTYVTGGTGAYDGVTGWAVGTSDFDADPTVSMTDGLLFMPR